MTGAGLSPFQGRRAGHRSDTRLESEQFGEQARLRYEALLRRAILDVAADPKRPGCHARPELSPGVLTYHLLYSRDHVPRSTGRVRRPRHFLVCRVASNDRLEIGRVLHDSMDVSRHLPAEYLDLGGP